MSVKITERITSRKNQTVIDAAKLVDRRRREETGTFVLEGIKLFREAARAGAKIRALFVTDAALEKYGADIGKASCDKIYSVTDEVFAKLSTENAPQGVFAVCDQFCAAPREIRGEPFALLLDGVADPGNLGTIIRCADALGVECVYIGDDGADVFAPKTVRAAMGSIFRVRTERCDAVSAVMRLRGAGYKVYAAMLDARAEDVRRTDVSGKVAFVVGNEGHGVSEKVAAACDGSVIIPMTEGIESLNAAVAASLLMWEAARGRLEINR
ncbi:MAG: RNA methyltransferase [Clostridia bacterium]|nr:RNA methyltransferase [Clostridia bacterium]